MTNGLNVTNYQCSPVGAVVSDDWHFPVGDSNFPPERWYAAQQHSATHTGLDLNLDMYERGDVERRLGLAVYAVADGVVTYTTEWWSGVPMFVIAVLHEGKPLWIRYAHIIPCVMKGERIHAGQKLGSFADWATGDHLHWDCATNEFEREWLSPEINWVDPVPILKAHLSPARVDAMLAKG